MPAHVVAQAEETVATPRYSRRLSDKIRIAFHQSCDQADYKVAQSLLAVLETMLKRRATTPGENSRRAEDGLVAAHERLWNLKHPDGAQS
jgi:hypothetical protein